MSARHITAIVPMLGKLIPRLASNHDGEVVATVRAIERVLKSSGRDWHDLTRAIVASPQPRHESRERDLDWFEMVSACLCQRHRLNQRERVFLDGMKYWRGHPTDRQTAWIVRIHQRLGAARHD
jgi:hypothetical protein